MHSLIREPLVITLFCLPICYLSLRKRKHLSTRAVSALWTFSILLLVAGVLGPILSATRHMIYHDEPTLIAVAAAELHGQPLYHTVDAADRYSVLYGPVAFWVYLPPMLLHITNLRIFQLWVIFPLLLSALLLFRICLSAGDRLGAALALLPYAVAVIMQSINEWAMKGDAWMLLFFSLQIAAAVTLPAAASVLLVALAGALLVNVKVTAVFLAIVPIALLRERLGSGPALLAALLTAVLSVLPFFVPGVSVRNFLFWLIASSHHGIDPRSLAHNCALILFMALPLLVVLGLLLHHRCNETISELRKHSLLLACSLFACLVAAFTGAKIGAGTWHCTPLAPMFCWFTAYLWNRFKTDLPPIHEQLLGRSALSAAILAQCLLGVIALRSSVILHWRGIPGYSHLPYRLVASDLVSIVQANPGVQIAMGYGGNSSYESTWQRPVLVLLGNRYTIDADAINESDLAHMPIAKASLEALRTCEANIYLIPKGDEPFSMRNLYFLGGAHIPAELFSPQFRQEFQRDFHKTSSSQYFDLYRCAP